MAPDFRSIFGLRFRRTKISSSTICMLTTRGTNTLKSRSGTLSRSPGVRLTLLQSEAVSEAHIGAAVGRITSANPHLPICDTQAPLFRERELPLTFAHTPLPKRSKARLKTSILINVRLQVGVTMSLGQKRSFCLKELGAVILGGNGLFKTMAPARGQLGPSFIGCYGGIRIRSCKANSIQRHSFPKASAQGLNIFSCRSIIVRG